MTTATSRKRQKKEADYNQPPWPNRLQLLNEIFISWAIYFSGNFTYTGIIIIYVRDMCILPTRLASHVFTEFFLFWKLLERLLGRCHGTFNKLFIFFLVLDKKSVSHYISFPRTVTLTSIKKYNPLGEENRRKPSMKQHKYFLDYQSIRFIFSQVFLVDESEVIFSIFYLFLL